jgi:hypothetical protein
VRSVGSSDGWNGDNAMILRTSDYVLAQLATKAAPLLRILGNVETESLRRRLDPVRIDKPVFVTGLARSGTTILLEQLASCSELGSHRYRDFPFLMTPYVWNRLLSQLGREEAPVLRPHGDRIEITRESPDAFEEPLWQHFFPHVHDSHALHRLTAEVQNRAFEEFYCQHIRKMLLLRGRRRYLSKGNYNVTRLEYLSRLFPDARFVVPVRNPIAHVQSLVRQHERFTRFAQADQRIPRYLAAAGHYEFGPQRVPIRMEAEAGDRTIQSWNSGEEHRGYAIQWAHVYRHVLDLCRRNADLRSRLHIVRYEDLCADPVVSLQQIAEHLAIEWPKHGISVDHIVGPVAECDRSTDAVVWDETKAVAAEIGYSAKQ